MRIKKMVGSEHSLRRQKRWPLSNIQCVRTMVEKEKEHPLQDVNIEKKYWSKSIDFNKKMIESDV